MRQRTRGLAKRGTSAFTSRSGQATTPAGPVALAQRHRRKARSNQQETASNEHAGVAVRGPAEAAIKKELPCLTRL
jgi:hypothetical protein